MVWYNITAYNIEVKFVLRNNKEKVICNNKNAEGVMQMKCKRNLERAIVLGLILSTGVCGSALAYEYNTPTDSSGSGLKISSNVTYNEDVNVHISDATEYVITSAAYIVTNKSTVTLNERKYDFTVINDIKNKTFENNALYARGGSNIIVDGNNVVIKALNGVLGNAAISAKNTQAGDTGDNNVFISGNKVEIVGDIDVTRGNRDSNNINTITVTLDSDGSYWYGDERRDDDWSNGILNVTVSNGAEWIYYKFNEINSITLNNAGIVNMQDNDIKEKYSNEALLGIVHPHKSVIIENLKGNGGIFKVDLDWESNKGDYGLGQKNETDNSDYIYIENVDNTTKTNPVQIVDFDASKAHLENMKINEDKLYFANVADGNISFTTLSSVYSNAGNVFDYTYGTGSEKGTNGTDWYIAVSGKSAESNPNFSAAKGAMYAGYALGTELDTLNKRMGEARYLEEDDGVWVRYRHSKTGWDDTYETNGDMFQLGFDNEVTEKDGRHYRGVAIDYTDADTNIMGISGEGEHERYAVSLYDTWLSEKGHYRDLVLRGGRINSDYDVSGAFSSGYEDIGGDYHQWFGSISAEWGRKNDMGTGWYFEPQVQAQLARIGGANYVSVSGVDVDQDGATSLIGRAGFRIGREYVKDNGKHDNFYIKADLLQEFAGDKSFSLTGNDGRYDKEYDGQETWCDVGIGADISLGKNSYFWADVERTFGADFDNTWQINGGFRWEF